MTKEDEGCGSDIWELFQTYGFTSQLPLKCVLYVSSLPTHLIGLVLNYIFLAAHMSEKEFKQPKKHLYLY